MEREIEFTIAADPMGQFKHWDWRRSNAEHILGNIPNIILIGLKNYMDNQELSYLDAVWNTYEYGEYTLAADSSGTVVDRVFKYPNDPDMYPICAYQVNLDGKLHEFLQYQYGMLAYVVDGEFIAIGRMD